MEWRNNILFCCLIGAVLLGAFERTQHRKYVEKYNKLQDDVQAVFGNEQPTTEALENTRKAVEISFEASKNCHNLENEIFKQRCMVEKLTADRKQLMIDLLNAQQQIRMLEVKLEILQKKTESAP